MYHVRAIMSSRNWHVNVVNAQRSTCIPSELTQINFAFFVPRVASLLRTYRQLIRRSCSVADGPYSDIV